MRALARTLMDETEAADMDCDQEGPLIRPFGAPSPQGEKGRRGAL